MWCPPMSRIMSRASRSVLDQRDTEERDAKLNTVSIYVDRDEILDVAAALIYQPSLLCPHANALQYVAYTDLQSVQLTTITSAGVGFRHSETG